MNMMNNFIDNFENQQNSYMIFNCAETKYAINIDNILEVIGISFLEYPKQLPNNSVGLLHYNNLMINVFDIRLYFNMQVEKYDISTKLLILKTDDSIFGLIADSVDGVEKVDINSIHSISIDMKETLIEKIYQVENSTINILDVYLLENLLKRKKNDTEIDVKSLFPTDTYSLTKIETRTNVLKEKSNSNELQNIFSTEKFITFVLNNKNYCMDIKFVKEISNNQNILSLPETPDFIEGLISIRGDFYTVINLKSFLSLKQQCYNDKKNIIIVNYEDFKVGFLVEEVGEIFELTDEEIIENQFLNAAPFIFNEVVKNEKIYTILDMLDILGSDKILINENESTY